MNLLIKNATVVLPDGQTKTANIAVEGSKILAIGEAPADFIAEQTDFYADIELSIRLWQILSLGMTALGVYKKLKSDSEVKK